MTVVCVICRLPKEAFKHFDVGVACHGCVLKATRVECSYEINGSIFTEYLKQPKPEVRSAKVIVMRRNKGKAAL